MAPVPVPRSHSVAPAPRPTERSLAAIARVTHSRSFDSIEELNAFLNSAEARRLMETLEPATPLARAQELAYDAWEASGPRRYQLARQALGTDPRCSDAWLILAEEERSWSKQRRCFERAVEAAERAAREEGWLEEPEDGEPSSETGEDGERPVGLYRRHIGLRAYVRAWVALARCLEDGGHREKARALYEDLLERDPDDPMGLRYETLLLYHEADDLIALERLLARYEDDITSFLAYERLWLALAQGRDGRRVRGLARKAKKANPHIPASLLRKVTPPKDDHFVPGSEEEAVQYALVARRWWLATPAALRWLAQEAEARQRTASTPVYRIKVTLRGSRPPIWRRFLVRGDASLADLHKTLQIVMGWTDTHLYRFDIGGETYGEPDPDWDIGPPVRDARRVRLGQVLGGEDFRFEYVYDFGDYWEHVLMVERVLPAEEGAFYPVCLGGRGACPPEDCGGIWMYRELREALANPERPDHEEAVERLGPAFDPERFDLDEVNEALRCPPPPIRVPDEEAGP